MLLNWIYKNIFFFTFGLLTVNLFLWFFISFAYCISYLYNKWIYILYYFWTGHPQCTESFFFHHSSYPIELLSNWSLKGGKRKNDFSNEAKHKERLMNERLTKIENLRSRFFFNWSDWTMWWWLKETLFNESRK